MTVMKAISVHADTGSIRCPPPFREVEGEGRSISGSRRYGERRIRPSDSDQFRGAWTHPLP